MRSSALRSGFAGQPMVAVPTQREGEVGRPVDLRERPHPHQRSIWRRGDGYNPGMRIRVLTAWVLCAMAMAQAAEERLHADRVVVLKKARTLQLLSEGTVIKTYRVALGGDPAGPKTRQGDHKTPEGEYILDSRNAHSQFHRSLHISYPNARDLTAARRAGVHLAAMSSYTDCRMGMDGLGPRIARGIGPMDVSP